MEKIKTNIENSSKLHIEDYFPFSSFREHQKRILNEVKNSFESGNDIVIIEGPTGFGKSPVNIALAKYFKPAFYTTPQKKLVHQLNNDFGPENLAIDRGISKDVMALLGRKNYTCRESNKPSDHCPIYEDFESQCLEHNCTYWFQKQACMRANVSIITFAMLIVNNYLQGESKFTKRNLLIVDECHSLEEQVASIHAGFTLSPFSFPKNFRKKIWEEINKLLPESTNFNDYLERITGILYILREHFAYCQNERERSKLVDLSQKIDYMRKEVIEQGRIWVVNILKKKGYVFEGYPRQFKPVRVDRFLLKMVWSQANKFILSSATIPFRNNLQKWLNRIGLGGKKFSFHFAPMTFPIEKRLIKTQYIGGKMTKAFEEKNWLNNVRKITTILKAHRNEKGVIHTQSYTRARKLSEILEKHKYSILLHDNDNKTDDDIIKEWIESRKQVLISPAITEGVDLHDDLCRFQILLKVPYPNIFDSRVKYLLNVKKQWVWYYNITALNIIQMYGRAVRSKTDYAKFYIIDGSFNDICNRVKFPPWFMEAIN